MEKRLIYHFVDDDELLRITNRIKEIEKTTSGEICVTIKEHRHLLEKKKNIRELAQEEFIRLGINKTKDSTGILIFILLEDRQFYIVADNGINKKVSQSVWDSIRDDMQGMFVKGEFCKGILHGLTEVGKVLSAHFPVKPGDKNEISDRVRIED